MAPGTFTLSFDVELAWGEFYRRPVGVERLLAARRRFSDLLRLLERHRIPATFAFVGHLLLEGCGGHPDWPRPTISWRPGDWLDGDPKCDAARAPLWYAPDLARAVLAADPGHDVGAHGFSHLPFDDPGVTAECAAAELTQCRAALNASVGGGSSFVFPRNGINYTELLYSHGFACYREADSRWYRGAPAAVRKAAHMIELALALPPPVGCPVRREQVVAVPSSMLFLSREGFRRHIPMRSRIVRAQRGLERAARQGEVFHLWLHAEDLAPGPEAMLSALDAVLAGAARAISDGRLVARTMAQLAASVDPDFPAPAVPTRAAR